MRCSLPTGSINEIDLCAANIEIHFSTIVLHLGHFNAPKSVLNMEKSAASQQIILNKNIMN